MRLDLRSEPEVYQLFTLQITSHGPFAVHSNLVANQYQIKRMVLEVHLGDFQHHTIELVDVR